MTDSDLKDRPAQQPEARPSGESAAAAEGDKGAPSVFSEPAIANDRLRSFVERIERLEEEKTALTADIREVYSEAKGDGFDTKILRQVIRLRALDSGDRQEQEAILDLYKQALGML